MSPSIINKIFLACVIIAFPCFSNAAETSAPLQVAHKHNGHHGNHHNGHHGDWHHNDHGWGKHTGYKHKYYFYKHGKKCMKSCYRKHGEKYCDVKCW
jgi:hypothetical protein